MRGPTECGLWTTGPAQLRQAWSAAVARVRSGTRKGTLRGPRLGQQRGLMLAPRAACCGFVEMSCSPVSCTSCELPRGRGLSLCFSVLPGLCSVRPRTGLHLASPRSCWLGRTKGAQETAWDQGQALQLCVLLKDRAIRAKLSQAASVCQQKGGRCGTEGATTDDSDRQTRTATAGTSCSTQAGWPGRSGC